MTINADAAETLKHIWQRNGIGWVVDEVGRSLDKVSYLLYYGTSTYNTKQMSRILDAVIDECKQCGIETLPPEQVEEMKRTWKREGKS